jgi:hypothetical protein
MDFDKTLPYSPACEAAGEAWDDAKGTGLCDGVPGERATWVCGDDGQCKEVDCANFVEGWPAQELVDAVYAACCDVKFLKKDFELSKSKEADEGKTIWNGFGEWPCRPNPIATPERGTCDGEEWVNTDPALLAKLKAAGGKLERACTGN